MKAAQAPAWLGRLVEQVRVVRGADAGSYLESFLVCAVATILATRLYLELTDYPKLGGGGLHIAHMLWGGLLMLAALVSLLAFLGRPVKRIGAIVGGIGFGLFIDELGKFITADNDYFYEPTMGLIYVIFVALFLTFRAIERYRRLTPEECLVNAADLVKEALLGRATSADIRRGLELVGASGVRDGVTEAIRAALTAASHAPIREPALPVRLFERGRGLYVRFVRWRWFRLTILCLLMVDALVFVGLYGVVLAVRPELLLTETRRSFASIATVVATSASTLLLLAGVIRLRRSRLASFRLFKQSVLVSIFVTQVFSFFELQLSALVGLSLDLLVLSGLNLMLAEERGLRQTAVLVAPAASDALAGTAPGPSTAD